MKRNKEAFYFFDDLRNYLNKHIPPRAEMTIDIKELVTESKKTKVGYTSFSEGAFLNKYITPLIHKYLVEVNGLSEKQATQSLLSESFRKLKDVACASPARLEPHPFQKAIGVKPQEIMTEWRGGVTNALPVSRCYPDIALR